MGIKRSEANRGPESHRRSRRRHRNESSASRPSRRPRWSLQRPHKLGGRQWSTESLKSHVNRRGREYAKLGPNEDWSSEQSQCWGQGRGPIVANRDVQSDTCADDRRWQRLSRCSGDNDHRPTTTSTSKQSIEAQTIKDYTSKEES